MQYEYWFAALKLLSDRKKYLLRKYAGSGKSIFYIEETRLRELGFLTDKDIRSIIWARENENPIKKAEILEKEEIQFIPFFSKDYPEKLTGIPDPPYAIFVKGCLPPEGMKTAAIVGARQCSPYGEKYALEYGRKLGECGVPVISGLARGIDGTGQRGALLGKGLTFAVLGCGVDICYPKEHLGLYRDILGNGGGILSEFPPSSPPLPQNFPRRNRIISGLSDFVLVIEAREKSGSLITADMALEQGRDVYALPGPVSSGLSQGCNSLIRQGAGILLSPEILLEDIGIPMQTISEKIYKNEKVLESVENMVYSRLGLYPKNLELLANETNMCVKELIECLVSLELKGYIKEISKNYYIKIK